MMEVQKEFRKRMLEAAKKKDSRIILACDDVSWRNIDRVLREARNEICAVKVHIEHPAWWGLSHHEAIERIRKLTDNALVILDAKLADIDASNSMKSRYYFEQGYDAIIVHGFPGQPAVKAVADVANEMGKGVFLLVAMSSEGHLFDDGIVGKLVAMAKDLGLAGVISPGNQYELTARVRMDANGMLILSPGIGAQGGDVEMAVKAGTDFAIVGRAILQSETPQVVAREMRDKLNAVLASKGKKL